MIEQEFKESTTTTTNHTLNYDLPLWAGEDTTSWLTQMNDAMNKIDSGMLNAKSTALTVVNIANDALKISESVKGETDKSAAIVAGYDDRLTAVENSTVEHTNDITELNRRAEQADVEIHALQAVDESIVEDLGTLSSQVTANTEKNTEQDEAIAASTQKNTEQDVAIAANTQKNTEQDVAIEANRRKSAEQDAAIAANTQKNTEQDVAIAANTQKNNEQDIAINANTQKNTEQDSKIASLEDLVPKHGWIFRQSQNNAITFWNGDGSGSNSQLTGTVRVYASLNMLEFQIYTDDRYITIPNRDSVRSVGFTAKISGLKNAMVNEFYPGTAHKPTFGGASKYYGGILPFASSSKQKNIGASVYITGETFVFEMGKITGEPFTASEEVEMGIPAYKIILVPVMWS